MNELREDTIDQRQASAQQARVDRIKRELDDEKEQMKRLRHRQQHKRDLERTRKERESHRQHEGRGGGSGGLVALRNARGQLIGWLRVAGRDRLEVLDSKGRLVAREISGLTLNAGGRLVGHGRLGLAVLGANSPKNLF
jgi:hypothetical protein